MASIMVIDDEAVIREPIAASIRAKGHHVTCASSGREAFTLLESGPPDLILLDVRMPQQDGMSILQELRSARKTAAVPVLLLSNVTDKLTILHAAKLGTQGYILKTAFSLDALMARINVLCQPTNEDLPVSFPDQASRNVRSQVQQKLGSQRISAPTSSTTAPDKSSWPRLLTIEQTLARVEKVAGGKTIAGVVSELISVANSPHSDLSDVARIIQSDPILAARVLQLANGASTGNRGRIHNVDDAARNLGIRAIQNMAMSIGIVDTFIPDDQDGLDIMRYWQHSYAVAEIFGMLMRSRDPSREGINHLIGLCHEMGGILLRQYFTLEYEQITEFAASNDLPVHSVQSVALGLRHPELVSRLLARLGLPTQVVQVIREFAEWQIRPESSAAKNSTSQCLALANAAAHGLLLATSMGDTVGPVTHVEWRMAQTGDFSPAIDPRILRNNILTTTTILARLSTKEEQRLLIPQISHHAKRIWYYRPDMFAEFDPLAFALTLGCDVTISNELPNGKQWHSIDAMVIVAIRAGIKPLIPEELRLAAKNAGRGNLPMLGLVSEEPPKIGDMDLPLIIRRCPISLESINKWLSEIAADS